jgi:ribosomal-protein-alanine N-acetyltransferase
MKLRDIPQVAQIERETFPSPWSATNFREELLFNRAGYYLVACGELPQDERDNASKGKWLDRLLSRAERLFGRDKGQAGEWIVGYVGLWFMADEAHLTTIAVRKSLRRQGMGELLLISAIEAAMERNAQLMTLEVRPSNEEAQALYRKCGFAHAGVRHDYYYDTGEDALLMSIEGLTSNTFQDKFHMLKQAHAQRWGAKTCT